MKEDFCHLKELVDHFWHWTKKMQNENVHDQTSSSLKKYNLGSRVVCPVS